MISLDTSQTTMHASPAFTQLEKNYLYISLDCFGYYLFYKNEKDEYVYKTMRLKDD